MAKGVKLKLLGHAEIYAELNQKILCPCTLSKGRICNGSEEVKDIKSKLLGNVEGNAEVNQKKLCASRLSKACIHNILGTDKGTG